MYNGIIMFKLMFFFVIFIHQGLRSLNELEPDYQLANQR